MQKRINETNNARDKVIKQYHKLISKNPEKARLLLKKLDFKQDHYVLFCIANTYWEEYRKGASKLRLTERYVTMAFNLNPECPFVLWLLGMVKWDYGQIDAAIYCYEDILELGTTGIIKEGCAKDKNVAKAQVNDSKFQLYRLYKDTNPKLAEKYLTQFKNSWNRGVFTLMRSYFKEAGINTHKIKK